MPEDRLDRIERVLEKVAKEQELFAEEMRQLQDAQDRVEEAQAKTDEQLRETDKYIKNLGKTVGELTGGWGRFVEGVAAPAVFKLVSEIGFEKERTSWHPEVRHKMTGTLREVDLLLMGS
jgi:hypothetical protein